VFGSLKALGLSPLLQLSEAEKSRHSLDGQFRRRNFGLCTGARGELWPETKQALIVQS
jgi:hypothetical protein